MLRTRCALTLALIAVCSLTVTLERAHAEPLQSWDRIITDPDRRFRVLDDFSGEAVLDRETQLVWEKSADTATERTWPEAQTHCYTRVVGGRLGWRLPTIEELSSLIDPSAPIGGAKLPPGHPFNVGTTNYWSSTTSADNGDAAWFVRLASGNVMTALKIADFRAWCVRGGHGHDAR